MAAAVLDAEGYQDLDPSHPLGGRDEKKDMLCRRGGREWVVAVYFPRGQQEFSTIKGKFEDDLEGVHENDADGLVFVTNQEIRLSERSTLTDEIAVDIPVELYHLERLAVVLDQPRGFPIRVEFLDIEMSKEEQVSFFSNLSDRLEEHGAHVQELTERFRSSGRQGVQTGLQSGGERRVQRHRRR